MDSTKTLIGVKVLKLFNKKPATKKLQAILGHLGHLGHLGQVFKIIQYLVDRKSRLLLKS